MSDSQTLYVRNPGSVAELEEWKRPREARGVQPGNRAELLNDDVQSRWFEDCQVGRSATIPDVPVADSQFMPTGDSVLAANAVRDTQQIAKDIPAPPLVPPSKLTGGWFREDPW